ncbi:MAG TPA: endonuclease/exonuclease/phosphatase family protein [Mycobacteriales bacterium]|nr:endonuclease/exonuclease/phosphatase family protein [Mycobacteriales bacterium]
MRRVRRWAPVAYPVLLVLLTLLQVVAPRRSGPLALAQVFAPWLALPLLFLLPFALALRDRVLAGALTLAVLSLGAHLGPDWSPSRQAPAPGSVPVRVVSWNVLLSNRTADVRDAVRGFDADVVGLVEVTPRQAARLRAEPPAYRTALLHPEVGRALYSRYPVLDSGVVADPAGRPGSALLWARLDLGAGRELTAVVAHPLPAESSLPALRYDAGPRDAEIAFVRAFTDRQIAAGRRVVLMGDFNVTDREPGGRELARGLADAHDAGWGPDPSWGPLFLREHGIALVRIDRILGGPGVVPTSFRTDCAFHGSDHCALTATVAVAR